MVGGFLPPSSSSHSLQPPAQPKGGCLGPGELTAWVTGDHEVFRAIAGVRPAGSVVHDHFVCAKCRATKRDVLAGDPFLKWKEKLPLGDLLPGVAVDMRGQYPLHGTRIVVSQLLNHSCDQMRRCGASGQRVNEWKVSLALAGWQ